MADGISESTLQESKANIEILNIWGNEPVQLAVTGKSGLGKSSFINAFRNLKPGDPGFATRNTTKHATVYKYPGNPKITLHDLPGFGSTKWPINKYGDNMELHKYDYVLIFFGNIEDNDIKIAKKLKEMKKPFCFVRSKIDIDFENPKNEGKPKAEAIKKIMSKSSDILGQKGLKEARIFALSIRNGMSGHFDELVLCIQHNLSKSKSNAVNMSMGGVLSIELIDNKYEILKERIWKVSLETAGLATVPVPGLSVLLNSALICNELWLYHKTFGFEQQTVKEISKDDCISQNLASSSIVKIDAAKEAIQQFISIQLETRGTLKAAQSVVGPFVPIIGPVVSGLTTYGATYILLNRVLDGCRDDAKLVYYHLRNSDFHVRFSILIKNRIGIVIDSAFTSSVVDRGLVPNFVKA